MQLSLFDDIFTAQVSIEDSMIEKALLRGPGIEGGKRRIKEFVKTNPPISSLAQKLKDEYHWFGWFTPRRAEGELHGLDASPKGLVLYWVEGGEEREKRFAWTQVARMLKRMMERREYA